MAEKRDRFIYEDLKREPGNLIEARDWNTAMWAIEEVGTRLTTLGDAVPRKNGANTLTGPLTIEDALTVGNHVVIRSVGTDGPAATLEVAGEVKVGTDATINGTLSVSNATITQDATITGKATISGTLTVTEQVRIQKNAIPEGTNDCQLEIFSPNTGKAQDYTKIRFHQHNQYYAWLGYHGLSANTAGEFVFFDLNAKKEAKVRTGALTCTADADVQGKLEVAGALKVRSHLTVEGNADVTDIVTAKDVHLGGTSVAQVLKDLAAREEMHVAWQTVVHPFKPPATLIDALLATEESRRIVTLDGVMIPLQPGMLPGREDPVDPRQQLFSLRGILEIPVQLMKIQFSEPYTFDAPTSEPLRDEVVICEVVSMAIVPGVWRTENASTRWGVGGIAIAAPWAGWGDKAARETDLQRLRTDGVDKAVTALRRRYLDSAEASQAEYDRLLPAWEASIRQQYGSGVNVNNYAITPEMMTARDAASTARGQADREPPRKKQEWEAQHLPRLNRIVQFGFEIKPEAPWTLRLLITYATHRETSHDLPPVADSRGLPIKVPMRLTA